MGGSACAGRREEVRRGGRLSDEVRGAWSGRGGAGVNSKECKDRKDRVPRRRFCSPRGRSEEGAWADGRPGLTTYYDYYYLLLQALLFTKKAETTVLLKSLSLRAPRRLRTTALTTPLRTTALTTRLRTTAPTIRLRTNHRSPLSTDVHPTANPMGRTHQLSVFHHKAQPTPYRSVS